MLPTLNAEPDGVQQASVVERAVLRPRGTGAQQHLCRRVTLGERRGIE